MLFFAIADRNRTIISDANVGFSDFSLKDGQISGGEGATVCFERGLVAKPRKVKDLFYQNRVCLID